MGAFDEKAEQRMITEIMELLVTHYGAGLSEEELDFQLQRVEMAMSDARTSHKGQLRKSGEPYIHFG